jgi:hypothetical protein
MHRFVLLMLVVATTFEYLSGGDTWGRFAVLPGPFKFVPELLTAIVLIYLLAEGARSRFKDVRPAYWLLFGATGVAMVAGVLTNGVEAGPIVAGLRTYVRGVPWFFVGAVAAFSLEEIAVQLKAVLLIALLQVPLAIEQRIKTSEDVAGFVAITGDWTTGTLVTSGTLSIFIICVICVAAACYERKFIRPWHFLLLFLFILTPTMINETKVTLVLLPLGLLIGFIYAVEPGRRLKRVLVGTGLLLGFGAIFVPVYDSLQETRQYEVPIGDFFFGQNDKLERYVFTDSDVGATGYVGRGDLIKVPVEKLAEDPVRFVFGYGIGNVSQSSLGANFGGRYGEIYSPFVKTTFARVSLELGWLGVVLMLAMHWAIFKDCRDLSRRDTGLLSAVAAGWTAVTAVIVVSFIYTTTELFPSLTYLYWYVSGLLVAENVRSLRGAQESASLQSSAKASPRSPRLQGLARG